MRPQDRKIPTSLYPRRTSRKPACRGKAYKTTVYLQRKTKTAKSYKTYKTLKSSSSGKISYSYTSGKAYDYRLVITDASGVWGTTSTTSYR